jgi:hypothetical protein
MHAILYTSSTVVALSTLISDPVSCHVPACDQVWGESNITVLNATTNIVLGPQKFNVAIRNGSDDRIREWHADIACAVA